MRGTVKWFNTSKGYGFITDSEGNDIFVHYCGLNMEGFKALQEGQKVTFDVIETEKGRQAMNVSVVAGTSKEDFEKTVDVINCSMQKILNGEE